MHFLESLLYLISYIYEQNQFKERGFPNQNCDFAEKLIFFIAFF